MFRAATATAVLVMMASTVTNASGSCNLGGDPFDATFLQTVAAELTCGARASMTVLPGTEVQNTGDLTFIAPFVSFPNNFSVGGELTVITPLITNFVNLTPVAIVDNAAVASTINVTGVGTYLSDVNLQTLITHTFNSDLDITIQSPAGTVVTLSTDNGGGSDDIFNGTFWDDYANPSGQVPYTSNTGMVTDGVHTNLATSTPLTPEEPLAAFVGEDPNGFWTLTISDDAGGDSGTLNAWNVNATTLSAAPSQVATNFANLTPVAIVDNAAVASTINVTGVGTYLSDVNLQTLITHTFNSDLDITIQSPAGTVVTLSTDNGGGSDDIFNGTFWDDYANPSGQVPYTSNTGMVTDGVHTNLVTSTPLTPEESLGAFAGEDPNGDWTLTISDDAGGDSGTLNSWNLDITTVN